MKNKLVLLGLMALLLLTIAPASAIKPTQSTGSDVGIQVASPIFDYLKANTTFVFNYHLFNMTDGMPFTAANNVSCVFHLYNTTGNHLYTKDIINTFDHTYDIGISVSARNFSKGFYVTVLQCNTSKISGFSKDEFEVTNTGIEPATDIMIIFSYMLFVAMVAMFIYLIVYSLEKFGKFQFNMTDLVYNIIGYIVLLVTYIFNDTYFGVTILGMITLTFVVVGVFSHIAAPVYYFMICYFRNLLDLRYGGKNGK